jgi:hypothetical protein
MIILQLSNSSRHFYPHLADDALLAQRLALRVDSPRRSDISGVVPVARGFTRMIAVNGSRPD